ncbi:MAG: penicillin-binding transpeptidase domain-containing protein [Eubacteriales bacterium]|nr:penicillin-binding protein [Sarcina sp.]MDO4416898.1 penicillin-binding transpeptidase domain-containing protein [Eubacteriales bacterium]
MKQSFLKRTGMWKRKGPDKGNPQVIQEQAKRTGRRRSYLLAMGSMALAAILILRLYSLQIIQGADYQQRFQSRIRRTVVVRAARGRILDKDGKVLAETVPTYNITMNDLTDDSSSDNNILNSRIRRVIEIVHENKDEMLTDFSIQLVGGSFYFKEMGQTARNRFLADIYGYADPAEMPAQNLQKTAADVVADLADRYGINAGTTDEEDRRTILEMVAARYNLSLNYYQKYIATTLAKDVSDETREAIESEFSSEDDGVQIEEELVRRYHNAQFFSNILGYTGEASEEYLEEHTDTDENGHPLYREGDTVGLTGIEASQEDILHGKSGQNTFNVDNIGRVTDVEVKVKDLPNAEKPYDAVKGRDVYLTIDSDLQIAVYRIIENNLRNIILSKLYDGIVDQVISEDDSGSSIGIPASNVYVSCLCNIIDSTHFTSAEASETERKVADTIESFRQHADREIRNEFRDGRSVWKDLGREMQTYQTLLAQALFDYGVITADNEAINDNDVYQAWENGTTSLYDLVREAIRKDWIDPDCRYLSVDRSGADGLMDAVEGFFSRVVGAGEDSFNDRDMRNALYKYMIINREISANQVCHLLLDQEIVDVSDEELESFESEWGESDFTFIYNRIRDMDLTPAQLHLYPSTASAVVTDPSSGDVLAMVSYPGYDTNRINDESYYRRLLEDPANPLLNYATQQLTAPGSTFKLVTATAALGEEVVDLSERVNCKKKAAFTKVKEDPNPPKCWIYPGRHKKQNLEGAIANSCNIYFYEMGYRLGTDGSYTYNSNYGVERIQKYAQLYGLGTTSGVEVSESEPSLLTGDPIRGAIGQDTNAFTTASLARYVSAVANSGTDFRLTLIDRIQVDKENISSHEKHIENTISLEENQWNAIHRGMRRVVQGYGAFNVLWDVPVAGKTGTAQQTDMPDNALFVGYAPYYEPNAWNAEEMEAMQKIALAVRIPNGYSSSYAAQLAADVIRYNYHRDDLEEIVDSIVLNQGTSND